MGTGVFSNYFQGTRELLSKLLGTREYRSTFNNRFFFKLSEPLKYKISFVLGCQARSCQKPVANSNALDEREPATGFAVIPYIQGVTEPIKRILNSHNVKVSQKPFQTLGHIFARPKDPVTKEQRTDAI